MATVYRADTIGSLLRPPYLKLAREQFEAGQLEPAAYKEIEDRAVDQAIAMQEGVGLDVVTDGELRRHTFIDQLTEQVFGLSPDTGDSGHIPVPFHDEAGQLKSVFTIPLSVTDKLQRRRMMTTEEFAYARARVRRPVKVTLPSPLMLFLVWSPQRSRDAYPDPFEMFADGLRLMKEEAEELARMGCRYIQVDAPDFGQLVDPAQRDAWEAAGISVDRVFSEGADMLNELAGVAGVSFGLHLCRGNYDSDWISTGTYETISKQLFQRAANYDTFLLEYDDERSGSFSALGDVPDDKTVVLGLVSTKFDRMEPAEQLAARISEAGGFFPLDQLALSTQCGFASAGPGNQISEDAQENKLRLVGEVADRVLGVGRSHMTLRHVLEDAAEVAETDGGVDALGHLRRLYARGPAAAVARVVRLGGGQRGAQPAPPGLLDRPDVVDAAVAAIVVRQRGRDHLTVGPGRQQVEGGVVGGGEEIEGQALHRQVLEPARRAQRDLRAGHGDVVERHAHGPRRGVQGVAAAFQLGAHRLVALVHPGGEAGHPGRGVHALHGIQGAGAVTWAQIALEHGVVVDGALGLGREHGGGHAGQAVQRRAVGAASVRLPGSEQGIAAAKVEFGVCGAGHVESPAHSEGVSGILAPEMPEEHTRKPLRTRERPPAARPACSPTASSYVTGYGWTGRCQPASTLRATPATKVAVSGSRFRAGSSPAQSRTETTPGGTSSRPPKKP